MLTLETKWWGHHLLLLETLSFPGIYSAHGSLRILATLYLSEFWLLSIGVPFAGLSSTLLTDGVPGTQTSASSQSILLSSHNLNEHFSLQFSPKFQIHILSHLLDISTWVPISHLKLNWPKKNQQALQIWISSLFPITNHPITQTKIIQYIP